MPRGSEPRFLQDIMAGNLRRLRKRDGVSQAALACRMAEFGMSWAPATTAQVETRRRNLSATELIILTRATGWGLDELLSIDHAAPADGYALPPGGWHRWRSYSAAVPPPPPPPWEVRNLAEKELRR